MSGWRVRLCGAAVVVVACGMVSGDEEVVEQGEVVCCDSMMAVSMFGIVLDHSGVLQHTTDEPHASAPARAPHRGALR